eukprot:c8896_g1_i1.p1 GENE.c8896_g1_i1~~c8896_g1_i1.p1  ORF type:complete len:460 (+),score=133.18 c8896_g1_i1:402-1781(+)
MPKPNNSKKHLWTVEEDDRLFEVVNKHGAEKWDEIAVQFPNRTGIQCRERWMNHLRPDVVKQPFTSDEDQTLANLVAMHGTRWALISRHFPGRSDSGLKNRYFSLVRHGRAPKPQSWALEIAPAVHAGSDLLHRPRRYPLPQHQEQQQTESRTSRTTTTTTPPMSPNSDVNVKHSKDSEMGLFLSSSEGSPAGRKRQRESPQHNWETSNFDDNINYNNNKVTAKRVRLSREDNSDDVQCGAVAASSSRQLGNSTRGSPSSVCYLPSLADALSWDHRLSSESSSSASSSVSASSLPYSLFSLLPSTTTTTNSSFPFLCLPSSEGVFSPPSPSPAPSPAKKLPVLSSVMSLPHTNNNDNNILSNTSKSNTTTNHLRTMSIDSLLSSPSSSPPHKSPAEIIDYPNLTPPTKACNAPEVSSRNNNANHKKAFTANNDSALLFDHDTFSMAETLLTLMRPTHRI